MQNRKYNISIFICKVRERERKEKPIMIKIKYYNNSKGFFIIKKCIMTYSKYIYFYYP